MQDEFLREVKSDLQREQFAQQLRRWGLPLAVVLIVVAVAGTGWMVWQGQRGRQLEQANLDFVAALKARESGKTADADAALRTLAQGDTGGYATLAQLHLAETMGKDVSALNAVVGNAKSDPLLRDVAAVLAGYRATDPVPGATRSHLEKLGNQPGPWQFQAREALALNMLQSGLADQAKQGFQALLDDPATPVAMQNRIQAVASAIPSNKKQQ